MLQRIRSLGLRRLCAVGWLLVWATLLWIVAHPWGALGGVVSERLRWLERFVLGAGLALGWTLGQPAKAPRPARVLLYPPALACVAGLVLLRLHGPEEAIGIVVVGWLSFTGAALTSHLGMGRHCRADEARSRDAGPGGATPPRSA